jgi:phenylpropionate dioxygenase-like ring-hydroxylating dioxygenase large terminal subunit
MDFWSRMEKPVRSANKALTMAGKYYTSEEIYLRETENIFMEQWVYAGRLSEVADPGSFLLVEIEK